MKRRIAVLAIALLAIGEGLARAAFDFPLYGADSEVGYWLLPDQQGVFLFSNDWAFNSDSLGVAEEFRPSPVRDVLLVGDSIVYGGNGWRQEDKLGPVLEARTGWQVWPAAAGSWALQNELAFLRRKPQLGEGVDAIVFVLNSGDFGRPSDWLSPVTHPRARPTLYLPYLFNRYVLKPAPLGEPPFPVASRDVLRDWISFSQSAGKPFYAVAYSTQAEAGQECSWVPSEFRVAASWSCYDGMKALGVGAFRDDTHPSTEGMRALADHLASVLDTPS